MGLIVLAIEQGTIMKENNNNTYTDCTFITINTNQEKREIKEEDSQLNYFFRRFVAGLIHIIFSCY